MDVQVEMIQPGWAVFASDGHEIGKVLRLEAGSVVIKHGGVLRSKEWHVPRTAVADVETGRIELNITASQLQEHAAG